MVLITAAPVFLMLAFAKWLFLEGEEKRDNSQSLGGRERRCLWSGLRQMKFQELMKRVPPVGLMQEKQGTTPGRSRSWEGLGKALPWGIRGCWGTTGTSSWGSLRPFGEVGSWTGWSQPPLLPCPLHIGIFKAIPNNHWMVWVGGDLKYPLVPAPAMGTQLGKTGTFGKYHFLNMKNKHREVQGVTFPPW